MKYMLLLHYAPGAGPAPGSPEHDAEIRRWSAVTDDLREAGVVVAGYTLQPADAARTMRARNGSAVLTEGPFAETEEILFAEYLLDVPGFGAAADWAARMPHIGYGSVEIRPLMEATRA